MHYEASSSAQFLAGKGHRHLIAHLGRERSSVLPPRGADLQVSADPDQDSVLQQPSPGPRTTLPRVPLPTQIC